MKRFRLWLRGYAANFIDLIDTIIRLITFNLVYPNLGLRYRISGFKKTIKEEIIN